MTRIAIVSVIATLLLCTDGLAQGDPEADEPPSERPDIAYAKPKQDESWKQDVLVALIGGGVRFRRIHLDVASDMGGTEPRNLDTGAYFDFAWHLFIRPMGQRSPRPAIRAMVLQVDGGSGIGVTVESDASISLGTNIWRMVGQFGYLHPIDRWQVGGLVGVGGDVLNIDLNSVMPSSRIVYARFGPAASVDAVAGYLTIRADFGLRFPFHLGEIANAFGQDSRAFGLDGTVTFQGRIKAGFTYGLRFLWEYYTYRFRGPVDNVPSMAQGGDGSDHAATLQVLVGWSL